MIYYFGDDEAYFKVFQAEFNASYGSLGVSFKRFYETTPSQIQSLYLRAYEDQPSLVLIDYSKHTNDYLHLARLFTRTINYEEFQIIGLLDYLSPPEVIQESILTGVKVNHIKSAEIFDVVYAAIKLLSPKDAKEHGFATAKTKDQVDVGILCKIGMINHDLIHFETDLKLQQNEEVEINNYWTQQHILKSKKFFIHNIQTSHIYYNFKYSVDAAMIFLDPPHMTDETPEERKAELKAEYDHELNKVQRKLKGWITDNLSRSQRKNVKVLIIDRELTMLHNQKPTDQYDYLIRCQPFLKDSFIELNRIRPNVIAFVLESRPSDAAEEVVYNDSKALKTVIEVVKNKFDGNYKPYIIVFRAGEGSSKELQMTYGYEQILAYGGDLSPDVLLKMAEVFSKKLAQLTPSEKELNETVYLKKSSLATFGEILTQVSVMNCSEADMIFQSTREFTPFSVIHFRHPVDMYVTIIPNEKFKGDMYYGLIHGIGETGKMELRKYVNSIFFRDLENQKQAEKEEFEKLNQAKLKEIQDEQNKKMAEAEAAKNTDKTDDLPHEATQAHPEEPPKTD